MKLTAARLDAMIWVLIYGGLFTITLGLALRREGPMLTSAVVLAGGAGVVTGLVLIFVRARSRSREPAASPSSAAAAPGPAAPPSEGTS